MHSSAFLVGLVTTILVSCNTPYRSRNQDDKSLRFVFFSVITCTGPINMILLLHYGSDGAAAAAAAADDDDDGDCNVVTMHR